MTFVAGTILLSAILQKPGTALKRLDSKIIFSYIVNYNTFNYRQEEGESSV